MKFQPTYYRKVLEHIKNGWCMDITRKERFVATEAQIERFENSEVFLMEDHDLVTAEITEVYASTYAMREFNLVHLPYKNIFIQRGMGNIGCDLFMVHETDEQKFEIINFVYIPNSGLYTTGYMTETDFIPQEDDAEHIPGGKIYTAPGLAPRTKEQIYDMRKDSSRSILTVAKLIVLLNTRGIESVKITPPEKLVKRALKRGKRVDAYHLVRPLRSRVMEIQNPGLMGDRLRPRLHLRRGHKRMQRWGRGFSKVAPIWIEPQLIGHAPDGTITHDYDLD